MSSATSSRAAPLAGLGALAAIALTLLLVVALLGGHSASPCIAGSSSPAASTPAPTATPGQVLAGRVSWFGGPNDPTSGPTTASGEPVTVPGIAVFNTATLGGYWRVTFPNHRTAILRQTDIGPAPYTGRVLDVLYSALSAIGYSEHDFPTDSTIAAEYLGSSPKWAARAVGGAAPELGAAPGLPGCPGAVSTTPGPRARILANGDAAAPAGAPPQVQAMIAAGNQIIHRYYQYGGGHPNFLTAPGLDCSSAVSYVLAGGHELGATTQLNSAALTSTGLETWGTAGAGRWVTVYANAGHTFVAVAGIYMNTVPGTPHVPEGTGPRWRTDFQSSSEYGSWTVRHPEGL